MSCSERNDKENIRHYREWELLRQGESKTWQVVVGDGDWIERGNTAHYILPVSDNGGLKWQETSQDFKSYSF